MDPTLKQLNAMTNSLLTLALALCVCTVKSQLLAPFDADVEHCANASGSTPLALDLTTGSVVLLDSYQYRSLQALWFADDENIDPFEFPLPEDPVEWQLVDQSECSNVWQYCGTSSSDILITQLITGALNRTNDEVVISVEYSFFSDGVSTAMEPGSGLFDNTIIVEVDDTTGLSNVRTETIPQFEATQQSQYHDFIYTPMNQFFEIVFRTNLSAGMCVNISRLLVFHCGSDRVAAEDPVALTIDCIPCPGGYYLDAKQAECLPCPSHSSSTSARSQHCVCDVEYERSLEPTNYSLPCDQCASGFYMTINDTCVSCPLPGFDGDEGSMLDDCRCFNRTTSVNDTCTVCAENYVRNVSTSECVLCPAGSRREVLFDPLGFPRTTGLEESCTCTGGSLTSTGENVTVSEPCDSCDEFRYWNTTHCNLCPANSRRLASDSTQCGCDFGSLTLAGLNTTTMDSCFCMSGFYKPSASSHCQICPVNSYRALNEPEENCACLEQHRRDNQMASLPCFAYVGFNSSSVLLDEGDSLQTYDIPVVLSLPSTDMLSVSIHVMAPDQSRNVEIRPNNISFLAGMDSFDAMLSYMGNLIALEEDISLTLSLAVEQSGELLIGGPGLHEQLEISIRDDDLLFVGFTENVQFYDSSAQTGSIGLNLSTAIGQDVVLLIRTNDTLSSGDSSQVHEFIFTVEGQVTSKPFRFDLSSKRGDNPILLRVELATYPESLNRVRNKITVGGREGLFHETVITIGGTGLLSTSAMIGIVCSVLAVCFALVVVTVILCVCCKKHVMQERDKSPVKSPATRLREMEMSELKEGEEKVSD